MTEELYTNKRLFGLDDLFHVQRISNAQLSPDGTQIVCVITSPDAEANCWKDQIMLLLAAGGEPKILTEGASPCWSPDGSAIAYEVEEGGRNGIWMYDLSTGKKRFLVPVYESAYFTGHLAEKKFVWSPDGKFIAYVSTPPFHSSDVQQAQVRVFNRLSFKTKGGRNRPLYTDDYLTHIWIIPIDGGTPELLTPGIYNEHSITWSPDSQHLAFISNRSENPDNNQLYDVWTVDCQTKQVVRITKNGGTAFQPSWSPDGKYITYLATTSLVTTNDSPAEDTHLYVIAPDGSSPQCLTKKLDRRIENICWHPDSTAIYFTAGNHGKTSVYQVSLGSEEIETVVDGNFQVEGYSVSADGKNIVYVGSDTIHPPELFLYKKNTQSISQLTLVNTLISTECVFTQAASFWFTSFDATLVQGWLMKPAVFHTDKTYPLLLVIHGGPHNMFGYGFDEGMQILAAQGYAVLFINPRGSSGYGQVFSNGCVLNWGGGDYKDLMAGVDDVISQNPWIDKERLGVVGQSYGGYMTNWIITQTTQFKAAVVDGGISNLISFAGTSVYHSLIESEFNGLASNNYPLLWQWSPLRNADKVTTPTLFLHGESDNEVPVSQAEEMYMALKKGGVDTTLVQYIGEGHGWRPDLKPNNRYDVLSRKINWFKQYLT